MERQNRFWVWPIKIDSGRDCKRTVGSSWNNSPICKTLKGVNRGKNRGPSCDLESLSLKQGKVVHSINQEFILCSTLSCPHYVSQYNDIKNHISWFSITIYSCCCCFFALKYFTWNGSFDKTVTELTGQFIILYEPVFQSLQAADFMASILKVLRYQCPWFLLYSFIVQLHSFCNVQSTWPLNSSYKV